MTPERDNERKAPEQPGQRPEIQEGLGEKFRNAREKLGLDYAQLAHMTRLRPTILKSLEKEQWDRLPSPVFVKGFLRSYARALKLPEHDILKLYREREPELSSVPEPLASLTPPVKRTPVALFIFLVVLVGIGFFAWHRYDFFDGKETAPLKSEQLQGKAEVPVQGKELRVPPPSGPVVGRSEPKAAPGAEGMKTGEALPDGTPATMAAGNGDEKKAAVAEVEASAGPTRETGVQTGTEVAPGLKRNVPEPPAKAHTLEAEVRETTWIRIFVDHEAPKEYVFRPGSHPKWKARESFEMIIGNAGGIALVFNGRKLDNLGRHGKVIRLKLPEKKKRSLPN